MLLEHLEIYKQIKLILETSTILLLRSIVNTLVICFPKVSDSYVRGCVNTPKHIFSYVWDNCTYNCVPF